MSIRIDNHRVTGITKIENQECFMEKGDLC